MTAQPHDVSTPDLTLEPVATPATTTTSPSGDPVADVITDWADLPPTRPRRRHHRVTRPVSPVPVAASDGDILQQTAMAVRNLTISVNRFRGALADALEISPTDVLALTEVSLAPAITPGDLADRIGVGIAGTSTVIDKLVRTGFLRRTPSKLDRRTYILGLTPAGTHAVGWISNATRATIAAAGVAENPPPDAAHLSGAPDNATPAPAAAPPSTIATLNALAEAYYHHADTLDIR